MSISGGFKRLRRLLDVDDTDITTGDAPTWDGTQFTMQSGGGGGGGGGGGSTLNYVADVTPGNAGTITRSGLQDFDGVTGVDGLLVFVYGGGGSNRINSGLWTMHSGAWTRPTGWVTSTDITGYTVAIKSGTVFSGVSYKITQGKILGTDAQFWSPLVALNGNSDPSGAIGDVIASVGSHGQFTLIAAPAAANETLISGGTGIQPHWGPGLVEPIDTAYAGISSSQSILSGAEDPVFLAVDTPQDWLTFSGGGSPILDPGMYTFDVRIDWGSSSAIGTRFITAAAATPIDDFTLEVPATTLAGGIQRFAFPVVITTGGPFAVDFSIRQSSTASLTVQLNVGIFRR